MSLPPAARFSRDGGTFLSELGSGPLLPQKANELPPRGRFLRGDGLSAARIPAF
jgi:hypothetical protein